MGVVTQDQVDAARPKADETGEGVVDTLVSERVLTHAQVAQAKAAHFNAEFVHLADMRISDEVIMAVPRNVAKKYNAIPVYATEDSVSMALADPSDLETIDSLQHVLNRNVSVLVASPDDIEDALNRYYGRSEDSVSKMIQDITEGEVEIGPIGKFGDTGDDGAVVDADAPIIKLVNGMIIEAYKLRASDIHLEPLEKRFRVRFRIDGVCHEMKSPPKRLQAS